MAVRALLGALLRPCALLLSILPHCGICDRALSAEIAVDYDVLGKGRLAFTYEEKGQKDIWVIDFQKKTTKTLFASTTVDEYPSFSPDGSSLAFYSDMSGDREIYKIDVSSKTLTRLTHSVGVDEDPSWSPDGKTIAFHSERLGKGYNLMLMGSEGSAPHPLTNSKCRNTVPKFSPSGDSILFSSDCHWPGWEVAVLDIASKNSRVLINGLRSYCRGSWLGDRGFVILSYGAGNSVDIGLFDIEKGELSPIVDRPGRNYDAIAIESMQKIVFAGEIKPGSGRYELFLCDWSLNARSTCRSVERLTKSTGSLRHPTWSTGESK